MSKNGHKIILAFLLGLLFLAACGKKEIQDNFSNTSTTSIESAQKYESSSAESASSSQPDETEESSADFPVVEWEQFVESADTPEALAFAQYAPQKAMSYEEYFSTERYLNSYELYRLVYQQGYQTGAVGDMYGYRYVKGEEDGLPLFRKRIPEDGLYLFCEKTGERVLLAEVEDIRYLLIFIDHLYLITDTEVWRCGRLGENLTRVYAHPSMLYIVEGNACSAEVLYFVAEGDPWSKNHDTEKPMEANSINPDTETDLWRLYLPTGQADKVCIMEDLPANSDLGWANYQPLSNYAVMATSSDDWKAYIYSMRTGKLSEFVENPEIKKVSMWDAWVRRYYPLNQY